METTALELLDGPEALLSLIDPWLGGGASECVHGRMLGLCLDGAGPGVPALWVALRGPGDVVVATAAWRDGQDLRIAARGPTDARALAVSLRAQLATAERTTDISLASSTPDEAIAFARGWQGFGDADVPALHMRTRVHRLTEVTPVDTAGGRLVLVTAGEAEPLLPWYREFMREAARYAPPDDRVRTLLLRQAGMGRLFAWHDQDGAPAVLLGLGEPTQRGARIAMVYTPPERRRRGHATAAVSVLSQRCLDAGRAHCALHTDVNNPGAARIYHRVGYREVGENCTYSLTTASD